MDARGWTIVVMVFVALLLIFWDARVAFRNDMPNRLDTISGITLGWSEKVWAVPYAFGILSGHLFWPALGGPVLGGVWSIPVLLGTLLVVAGIGWKLRREDVGWVVQGPILVVVGVLFGHLLWPQ
jgi:hypothetical protein